MFETIASALKQLEKEAGNTRTLFEALTDASLGQAVLKVPGMYGPSLEDWAQHGMTIPEI